MPATTKDFRCIALSFPETEERAHMDHPDFRVAGKIFATLGYPNKDWGMVKLTPMEQERLVAVQPGVFVPAAGAWGRGGATTVKLAAISKTALRAVLAAAWRNLAPKYLRNPPLITRTQ
jgi:hypothetical protein